MLYGRESRRVIACRANFIVSNPKIPELYPPPQPLLLVPRLFAIIHVSCEYILPGTRIYRESCAFSYIADSGEELIVGWREKARNGIRPSLAPDGGLHCCTTIFILYTHSIITSTDSSASLIHCEIIYSFFKKQLLHSLRAPPRFIFWEPFKSAFSLPQDLVEICFWNKKKSLCSLPGGRNMADARSRRSITDVLRERERGHWEPLAKCILSTGHIPTPPLRTHCARSNFFIFTTARRERERRTWKWR